MKKQFDISDDQPNTFGRPEITCPFCGYEIGDSWEVRSESGERECDECGNKYQWSRDITIEYSSDPVTSN